MTILIIKKYSESAGKARRSTTEGDDQMMVWLWVDNQPQQKQNSASTEQQSTIRERGREVSQNQNQSRR